jgi:hypothetical protein
MFNQRLHSDSTPLLCVSVCQFLRFAHLLERTRSTQTQGPRGSMANMGRYQAARIWGNFHAGRRKHLLPYSWPILKINNWLGFSILCHIICQWITALVLLKWYGSLPHHTLGTQQPEHPLRYSFPFRRHKTWSARWEVNSIVVLGRYWECQH